MSAPGTDTAADTDARMDRVEGALPRTLDLIEADEAEVMISARDGALTRFSNSAIHQNVAETGLGVSVRAVVNKQTGYAAANQLDDASLAEVAGRAREFALLSPADPEFVSLAEPRSVPLIDTYSPRTARFSPDERAQQVLAVLSQTDKAALTAAGSLSTSSAVLGIANSRGVLTTAKFSEYAMKTVVLSETSSGYSEAVGRHIADLDGSVVADRAVRKAVSSQNPTEIEPGAYTVILEPNAVADMVAFLAYCGLGALSFQEQRSFMCDHIGQRVASPEVTIWDDALDGSGMPMPFDFEGVPKRQVTLIEDGVARGVVYDTATAHKAGRESTGHALPAPNSIGPIPTNLFVAAGDTSLDEMIADTERGVLVTRFHYTNIEDPMKTIYTGMTRDGTFLIEKGRPTAGLRNMRFTQSILEALSAVAGISSERELCESMLGPLVAPAMKIEGFHFTGVSK